MRISDRQFLALKRLQVLTGVVPVGLFLISHFAINGRAIAGREAYGSMVAVLDRLPLLPWIEAIAIGLPLLAHLGLGVALGLTRQAGLEPPFPDARTRWAQRASGFYLAMYVVFHVWSLRLAPERLSGRRELFDLVAAQLRDPAVFALHAIAVIAAGTHFSLGCAALAGPRSFSLSPVLARRVRRASAISGVLLVILGLHALLAFVWAPARWLAP